MFSGSRKTGRRACAAHGRGRPDRHPGRTHHAGTRWVTERITAPAGAERIRIKTEMTGTNDTTGAVRLGRRQRQLLRKEEAGYRRSFCRLTAHANGRPLSRPLVPHVFTCAPLGQRLKLSLGRHRPGKAALLTNTTRLFAERRFRHAPTSTLWAKL